MEFTVEGQQHDERGEVDREAPGRAEPTGLTGPAGSGETGARLAPQPARWPARWPRIRSRRICAGG